MRHIELIILLLAVVTLLAEVADHLKLPYPVLLVLVGMAAAVVPGLPKLVLAPELVFLLFLPPLLYAAAWNTSWPDFKAARRTISLHAVGGVLFTTGVVALAAHSLWPEFGWPIAFVLGAIVSPSDAVAATSVLQGLGLPRRVTTVLEGESLVNDATGLIAYRYALAAVLTGQFGVWQAGGQLLWVAAAGAGIGLTVGWGIFHVHRLTHNPIVDTGLTFLTPYLAYLAAEEYHVSGVLAVVAAGVFLSRRMTLIFDTQARLQTRAVWSTITLLLNGRAFAELRAAHQRGRYRQPPAVGVPGHVPAPLAKPRRAGTRTLPPLAARNGSGLDGDARRGVAGLGIGVAAGIATGRAISASQPAAFYHLRSHFLYPRGTRADAAATHPVARHWPRRQRRAGRTGRAATAHY
jgi:hypothetical protein